MVCKNWTKERQVQCALLKCTPHVILNVQNVVLQNINFSCGYKKHAKSLGQAVST